MPRNRIEVAKRVTLSAIGERADFEVRYIDYVTFSYTSLFGAWSSGVITLKVSRDGARWFAYPSATTATAEGASTKIDTYGYSFVCWEVTTAEAGVCLEIICTGEGQSDPPSGRSTVAGGITSSDFSNSFPVDIPPSS